MLKIQHDSVELYSYIPGAIARITELHILYYGQHWQFGLQFEAEVAAGLAEFLLRFAPTRDGF